VVKLIESVSSPTAGESVGPNSNPHLQHYAAKQRAIHPTAPRYHPPTPPRLHSRDNHIGHHRRYSQEKSPSPDNQPGNAVYIAQHESTMTSYRQIPRPTAYHGPSKSNTEEFGPEGHGPWSTTAKTIVSPPSMRGVRNMVLDTTGLRKSAQDQAQYSPPPRPIAPPQPDGIAGSPSIQGFKRLEGWKAKGNSATSFGPDTVFGPDLAKSPSAAGVMAPGSSPPPLGPRQRGPLLSST